MHTIYSNKQLLKLALLGMVIGMASITPGLSGGAIAISFGVYAKAIDAVVSMPRNFKNSIMYLLPLGMGALVGILLFGIIMKPLLSNFENSIIYLFIGMIIGSLPSFLKEANKDGFRFAFIIPLVVAFALGVVISTKVLSSSQLTELSAGNYIMSGAVLSVGLIVPGISSSFILINMGMYDKIINSITQFDIISLLWVALGFIATTILIIKAINVAFNKFSGYAHYASLGFLFASVITVFPTFEYTYTQILNIILLIIGIIFIYLFMKKYGDK
ncbi:MAG: DUF368 domain-containing protein [Ruminococcaceae bacterium]|nr:DUF368 domain-containing protein [Oscillospiraceae bacterium]